LSVQPVCVSVERPPQPTGAKTTASIARPLIACGANEPAGLHQHPRLADPNRIPKHDPENFAAAFRRDKRKAWRAGHTRSETSTATTIQPNFIAI
jgi:hypothetical protein